MMKEDEPKPEPEIKNNHSKHRLMKEDQPKPEPEVQHHVRMMKLIDFENKRFKKD